MASSEIKPANDQTPEWQYSEMKYAGVDYADPRIAEDYDAQHVRKNRGHDWR